MALDGRSATITTSPTAGGAGVYTAVGSIASVKLSHKGNNIDVTVITASYVARQQGLKDMSWSLSGFYDPSDTLGQVAIRSAWLNDSTCWLKYLPNGTAGVKQEVKIDSFDWDGSADGMVEVSIEASGTGTAADV